MSSIAIIPARGGSKRIPKKNIKDFCGKPAIAYAIEAALASELFDEIIVSTDSHVIAEISKEYGASVPFFRSEKNSDDYASTADVLKEVLGVFSENNKNFDFACCIYPVNPFLDKEKLISGYEMLKEKEFDTVFSAMRYSYPIQRSFRLNEEEKIRMIEPEHLKTRSQDLEPTFHDAAQFYWLKTNSFLSTGELWTNNTGIVELNELEVQDIDTLTDWKLAELKFKMLYEI